MERIDKKKAKLLEKCFDAWKYVVNYKNLKKQNGQNELTQKEKLENLIKTLKDLKKQKEQKLLAEFRQLETKDNYKNRFEAQKNAIKTLTRQLEEKNHLIDELRVGIFDREALKAINQTKIEIQEIFAKCSTKVRCKIPPPPEYSEKFMISTQKAPKIIKEMEGKALERAKKRQIIAERKRLMLENRQRIIEEALEKKRIQDEEEKKRNLNKLKEDRRRKLETQKKREANKQIYIEKFNRALQLYREKLKQRTFKEWTDFYIDTKQKENMSKLHYKIKLLNKILFLWKEYIQDKYKEKNALADAIFAQKILTTCLNVWREFRIECVRSMQVAHDYNDLMILNNSFLHWNRHICMNIIVIEKKMISAKQHYEDRLKFHSFYSWRSLPAVNQLEKAKEMKLKKWRAKVWEVLPDYKPPSED